MNLKLEIQKAIENAVRVMTKELVNTLIKNQDIAEKRNEAMLNSLNSQIEIITNSLVSPKSDDFNPEQFHTQSEHQEIIPQPDHHQQHQNACQSRYTGSQDPANAQAQSHCQKNQCEVCGKTFGSDRALKNHLRSDHVRSNLQI